MSAQNVRDALKVPGRLIINPSDLTIAFPHGGTELGLVRGIRVAPGSAYQDMTFEEFGGEIVDKLWTGDAWALAAILESFDADAISTIFQNTSVDPDSDERVIEHPGTVKAGTFMSTRSVVLLLSPDDLENHPGVLFYRAIPMLDETAEITLRLADPLNIAVMFAAIRDTSARVVKVGQVKGLTL